MADDPSQLSTRQLLDSAEVLRRQGRHSEAMALCRQAVAADPGSIDALLALAAALRESGSAPEALHHLQQALRLQPGSAVVLNEIGVVLARLGRRNEAAAVLRASMQSDPSFARPLRNLASLYIQAGRPSDAEPFLSRLIALDPDSAQAHQELGWLLVSLRQFARAVDHFTHATRLKPDYGIAWCNLGLALEELKRIPEAVAALQHAARLLPDVPAVRYHLAALGAGTPPPTCPPDYLVPLFDGYAADFESHLVDRLGYRGPQLLLEAVRTCARADPLDILDLGCGTGLCGILFRPLARRLVGVDLAPNMLQRSRRRAIYDELLQEDVVPAMSARPDAFDLVLAGDVFIYIGELSEVFAAAATALRQGGLLAFTIEACEGADFRLLPSRRYAQSEAYIRQLSRRHGFSEVSCKTAVLRRGDTGDVVGRVFVLRRENGPLAASPA